MKKIILSIMLILLLLIAGCGETPVVDDSQSTEQGVKQIVDANNQFAFELYKEIDDGKNVFFSPFSISTALAMTYEGAKGQTAEEMADVFHFPTDADVRRPNFAKVFNNINNPKKSYKLHTANALWPEKTYPFLDNYIKTIENYYGSEVNALDYKTKTEQSRVTINDWVEDKTNDKIKDLIPAGVLNTMTRLVLTNAIYFKGTWEWEFDKSDTRDMDFKKSLEETIKVPMMYMDPEKASLNYASLEKLQILELPYKGDDISMLILLPKQGRNIDFEIGEMIEHKYTLDDIELSAEKLEEYRSQMQETKMDGIYLPKFKFETKSFMKETLKGMGMPTAFKSDGSADFSGMDGTNLLYISEVIHQAYVDVNEEGTEAAAATAVVMEVTAIMPTNIFKADHPFIFIIQEKDSGNILFMGKVVDPTAK